MAVVERLDPVAVAREHEATARRVPDRDREHPAQPLGEAGAVLLVEMDERLGVGVGAERVPGARELVAQLGVVVDLAVLDDDDAAVLVRDRLVAAGEVDDREAPRAERDLAVDVLAGAVGAAVDELGAHRAKRLDVGVPVGGRDPADPAHAPTLGAPPENPAQRLLQHAPSGRDDRAEVEPDGAVGDPLEVVRELLRHRRLVAAAHLREAGQAGPDDEPLPVRRQLVRKLLEEDGPDRTRPDETHVAAEDVEELRDLVELRRLEPTARSA